MLAVNDKISTKEHGIGLIKKVGCDPEMTYLVRFKNGILAWLAKNAKFVAV